MKLNQHSWLVSLLSQHPQGYTLSEINEHWQRSNAYNGRPISRTSLFRARDTILNQFGILIECEFHKSESRYKIGNPSELQRDSMKNWLYSNLTVGNMLADHTALKDHIILENTPINTSHLHDILQAMRKHREITIEYKKYTSDLSSQRLVAPIALKLWKQRWYLLAQQHGEETTDNFYDNLRIFSLNRIKAITLTDTAFKIPRDFSPQSYFSDCYGVLTNHNVKPERIVIRAYGQTPYYLKDLPLHHSQKVVETTSDHTDFELYLKPTPDFQTHLLTHGAGLKVLSPLHLAQEMRRRLCEMLRQYDAIEQP